MHIPTYTDQMLENCLDGCASPVLVEWGLAGDLSTEGNHFRMELVAEEFDDRVIFLRVWIDENPTIARRRGIMPRGADEPVPGFTLYQRGECTGRILRDAAVGALRQLIEIAIGRASP